MIKEILNSIGAVFYSLLDTSIEVFSIGSRYKDDFESRFATGKEKRIFYEKVAELSRTGNTKPHKVTIGNKETTIIVD